MSKQVLIVEDSETCAETLQIALELIPGVEVRSIHSPLAAIAILNEPDSQIAAIITDLNLDLELRPQRRTRRRAGSDPPASRRTAIRPVAHFADQRRQRSAAFRTRARRWRRRLLSETILALRRT